MLFENFSNIKKEIEYLFGGKNTISYLKFKKIEYLKYLEERFNQSFSISDFYVTSIFDGKYIMPKFMAYEHSNWYENYCNICELGSSILTSYNDDVESFTLDFLNPLLMCSDIANLKTDYSDIKLNRYLDTYIKSEHITKFRNYLKKANVIPIKDKLEVVPRFEKDVINGIKLSADSIGEIETLKNIILTIEKRFEITVSKKYLNLFRLGKIDDSYTAAMYLPKSKLIKLNKNKTYISDVSDYFSEFIHEYTHAIDMKERLYNLLKPEYEKMLNILYNKTNDTIFKIDTSETSPIFKRINIPQPNIYGGKYNDILKENGYPRTYCITKLTEFVACTLEHYFMKKYSIDEWSEKWELNTELNRLCLDIHNTYFKN